MEIKIEGLARLKKAIHRVEKEINKQRRKIVIKSAQTYQVLLIGNIFSQKYATGSWAYNPTYKKWKNKNYPGGKYWQLTGDLLAAITISSAGGYKTEVGIRPKEYSSRSGYEIGKYAIIMEFGNKKQKPRPVFQPTFHDFYDDQFQTIIDDSCKNIVSQWY